MKLSHILQALREELARQRTTMLSNGPDLDPEKTARYAGQITKLEDQVARYSFYTVQVQT